MDDDESNFSYKAYLWGIVGFIVFELIYIPLIWLPIIKNRLQTFEDLEQLVTEGIDYFTHSFISGKRNDLTAAEYRFGKANQFLLFNVST